MVGSYGLGSGSRRRRRRRRGVVKIMAFVHGKGTKVFIDATEFSSYLNNVDVTKTADVAETTNFGSSGVKHIFWRR
ncbi:MAG: hypothetical protein CM15mV92_320 [Caudoviricetes sp.]|nr:MAG: hypothetical protein CM15mV92_320 [Caudoviricetes sp.]